MEEILLPLLSYVFVTTFTPGPNNITSAALGMRVGYRGIFRYLLGICAGFLLVMLVCGLLTETVVRVFPGLGIFLRIAGSGYMLWLAFSLLRPAKQAGKNSGTAASFGRGFLLQVVNPKVIIYGITIFSSFLAAVIGGFIELSLAALVLTVIGFVSISLWALFGAAISKYLGNPRVRLLFNVCMAGLLCYSALSIAGLHLS